jgi:virginiamycin B lyase
VGPDGAVWYTGNAKGLIGRLDPATGAIKEFTMPAAVRDPHTPLIHDGKIWFTAQGANLYGRLDPATGAVKTFPLATSDARPYGLVAAPDGSLWMALLGTNKVDRINPADGALHEITLPAPGARPRRLQVDAEGTVWYTDYARGYLGRIDPASGQVREFASPGGSGSGHRDRAGRPHLVRRSGDEPDRGVRPGHRARADRADPHARRHRAEHDGRFDARAPVARLERDATAGSDRRGQRALA